MSSNPRDRNSESELIDEACRHRFEQAWRAGERIPISECLPEPGSECYKPTLEQLIRIQMEVQWQAAADAGTMTTDGGNAETVAMLPTLVEQYVGRFPETIDAETQCQLIRHEFLIRQRVGDQPDLDDYRNRFPDIDIASILAPEDFCTIDADYDSAVQPAPVTETFPDAIEGYDLLERIGAGGMGVVYRARQLAADRIVALKLIRADRLEHVSAAVRTDVIERFRIEAQATARLDHPNVVGIFEVNTSNPAQPWFSMQFVKGRSLSEQLVGGPVECRLAAEFSRQISSAVAAAHANGILHRDLKPQNIFLRADGKHVLVGDFGLAKFAVDDSQRTSNHDILGTPAYMSPEQIRNSASVRETADIWSIGATLYHLVTGRPPFQAASAMETLRQVLEHEPTSPRNLNPEVDRDLETICLKCLQKNPQQRYLTATSLVADLSLYLEGRPITARPVSRTEHVYRWCRRNPLAATLAASAMAGVLIAIVGLSVGYRTAAAALEESNASHLLARETVHDLFTEVSETVLLEKPGMQPLRRRLHERALSYYRRFVETGRDSPELREETGDVWFRIGRIEKELGRPDEAALALRQALTLQQRLVSQQPTVPRRKALSSTWNAIGSLDIAQHRWNEAADALLRAHEFREALVTESPTDAELQRLYSNTIMNLGAVHRNRGELIDALNAFRKAAELQRELLSSGSLDPATDRNVRRDYGMALYNSANAAFDIATSDIATEVLDPLTIAAGLFVGLLVHEPDSYTDKRRLVLCRQLQAEANPDTKQAARFAVEAAQEMQQLIAENPAVPSLVREWVQLQLLSGRLFSQSELQTEAMECFDIVILVLSQQPEGLYGDAERDLGVATAEGALSAAQLSATDAVDRLTQGKELLEETLAQTAGDQKSAELLQQVNAALAAEEE